jgi:hypothetical protein
MAADIARYAGEEEGLVTIRRRRICRHGCNARHGADPSAVRRLLLCNPEREVPTGSRCRFCNPRLLAPGDRIGDAAVISIVRELAVRFLTAGPRTYSPRVRTPFSSHPR